MDRNRPRAGDALSPRPHVPVAEPLVPVTVGPCNHLRAVRLLGLPGHLDEPDHLRHVGERVRAERPHRADVCIPRTVLRRLDVLQRPGLRAFVVARPEDAQQEHSKRGRPRPPPGHRSGGDHGAGLAGVDRNRHATRPRILYTMMWSIFIAYAVARYRYLAIEPVV